MHVVIQLFRFVGAVALATSMSMGCQAATQPAISAEQVVERYVDAIGGIDRLRNVRSFVRRGSYSEPNFTLPDAVLALMRPYYKLVGDPDVACVEFCEGYDGSAWEHYVAAGLVVRTIGAPSEATRHHASIDPMLVDHARRGSTVELIGIVKIAGRPAYQLRVRLRDGYQEDQFIDAASWLLVASRKVAKIHAFGEKVSSETRFSDYRSIDGIHFPFLSREVDLESGKELNRFVTRSIELNPELDVAAFSPPEFKRTPTQSMMMHLLNQRGDPRAMLWTYEEFRLANPGLDTDTALQTAGFQLLKMDDHIGAVRLLEANAADYPHSSGAHFGLGRAYRAADRLTDAKRALSRAVELDASNARAAEALENLQ